MVGPLDPKDRKGAGNDPIGDASGIPGRVSGEPDGHTLHVELGI